MAGMGKNEHTCAQITDIRVAGTGGGCGIIWYEKETDVLLDIQNEASEQIGLIKCVLQREQSLSVAFWTQTEIVKRTGGVNGVDSQVKHVVREELSKQW